MRNFKHLSKEELSGYSSGSLKQKELQRIGKHLLNCPDCRERLPIPSVERFWAAILNDSEIEDSTEKDDFRFGGSSIFSTFLKLDSGLIWGGSTLIVIISFSLLLWLNITNSGGEVVRTFDTELGSETKFHLLTITPANEKPLTSTNTNRLVVKPTPKINKTEVSKPKAIENKSRQELNKVNLNPQKEKIVTTRGISVKCNENNSIELEYLTSKENLVFKWKAVSKAIKYHLYISDDEEILIDEFETPNETTFVLKKSLDPLKTYKWKIIITLENGKQLVGNSQKFTMKDFQTNHKKVETKRSSDTRCSANS